MRIAGSLQPQNVSGTSKLESLQLLRGFAAMLIVIFHAMHDVNGLYFQGQESSFGDPTFLIFGIDLFFVISGFIMVYTAFGKAGINEAKGFILRRMIRVVPLYWFFTMLLLAIYLIAPAVVSNLSISATELMKSLFFVPYRDEAGGLYPFLKIGWTLNYEMYFYLVFSAFMLLPVKAFMPALTAFFILTIYAKSHILPEGVIRDFYGHKIMLNFLIGTWIGWAFLKGFRLPSWSFWIGGTVLTLTFIWLFIARDLYEQHDIRFPRITMAGLIVFLIVLAKGWETVSFPKALVFLGDSSYSLYLAHSFAIGALVAIIGAFGLASFLSPWIVFALCLIVSIIAGSLSYLLIEKPLLSASKRLILSRNKK